MKGVDASGAAVRYARGKGKQHGLTPNPLSYDRLDFPFSILEERYDLVVNFDGPVNLDPDSLSAASSLLAPGGLLVYVGLLGGMDSGQLSSSLSASGLSLALADAIGGWDGNEFTASGLLILQRGEDHNVPRDWERKATSIWEPGFRDYANCEGRPPFEKTVGMFRTHSLFDPQAS